MKQFRLTGKEVDGREFTIDFFATNYAMAHAMLERVGQAHELRGFTLSKGDVVVSVREL